MENMKPAPLQNRPRMNSFILPSVNPFVYDLQLTEKQKIQIALMSATVAPVRLVLLGVTFVTTWLCGLVFTYGMEIPFEKPASPLRLQLFEILRKLGRLCFVWLGFHKIEVRGKRALGKDAPVLVVAPHSSMLDTFVLFVSNPLPSSVSRIENYQAPMFGTLSKAVQAVYVSRSDSQSRRKTIDEIKQRTSIPGKWPQIVIFPEGTCTNRKALITFKSGAFIPGCAVQPVLIEYLNAMDTYTWTMTGIESWKVLWYTLCQFSSKVRVTYLPVYHPSSEEKKNPKLFARNVRIVMADALNIPCTDHTFEDCRLMRKASALNLPMESGLVEFAKISQKLGMNIDGVQDKLQEFSKIACERSDGLVSLEDFANFLNMPISDAVKDMFRLYDRNDSGFIDFREYVIGLSLVSQPAVTDDTVKLAFKVFDKDHSGMISKEEFNQVLHAVFENEIDGSEIYDDMEKSNPDGVTFLEFHEFIKKRPEYAHLFVWYKEMLPDGVFDPENLNEEFSDAKDEISENASGGDDESQHQKVE